MSARRKKRFFDYFWSSANKTGKGAKVLVEVPIGFANATYSSAFAIPSNAIVTRVYINVTTPYSGGATITVGQTGSASLVAATTDSSPSNAAALYDLFQRTSWGASNLPVLVTIGGAPAAGVAVVGVEYSLALS